MDTLTEIPERLSNSDAEAEVGYDSPSDAWTQRRLEVLHWLKRDAPAIAPVYAGAVRIAASDGFPGRAYFVAHAIREIRNRLPGAIAGEEVSSRTEYSDLTDVVYQQWQDDGFSESGAPPASVTATEEPAVEGPSRYDISAPLLEAVGDLIREHRAVPGRKERNAHRLFEAVAEAPAPRYVVKAWLRATNRAETYAHLRNRPLRDDEEESVMSAFAEVESTLSVLARRSYENMDELDEILDSANR